MSYSQQQLLAIWQKAYPILNREPNLCRNDMYGNEIHWLQYGNRDSPFGWEVHHYTPVTLGGGNDFGNLVPLHWQANASQGGILGNR